MSSSHSSQLGEKEELRKAKLKKQEKKMTKILSKAWSLDHAEIFQEVASSYSGRGSGSVDLISIGQNLESGGYVLGRKGWEAFAAELGFVYNQFIGSTDSNNRGKAKVAKQHLQEICALLAKIDPSLETIAANSTDTGADTGTDTGTAVDSNNSNDKKRKFTAVANTSDETSGHSSKHIPKKHHFETSTRSITSINTTETSAGNSINTTATAAPSSSSSISQREEKAMKNLVNYIIQCGGEKQQLSSFRCKVTQSGNTLRYDTCYFNESNRKFRSMVDVARFLNLNAPPPPPPPLPSSSGGGGVDNHHQGTTTSITTSSNTEKNGGRGDTTFHQNSIPTTKNNNNNHNHTFVINHGQRPRNMRELEAERKKLKRELDKLMKAHAKATKAVDDFQNERGRNDNTPIDDDELLLSRSKTENPGSSQTKNNNCNDNNDDACDDDHENHNNQQQRVVAANKSYLLQQFLTKTAFQSDDGQDFAFTGLPPSCTQDALMVWDFLCTFSRTLSLEPIDLERFIAALNYKPHLPSPTIAKENNQINDNDDDEEEEQEFDDENQNDNDPLDIAAKTSPPIYLAEAHLAVVKLLLKDTTSDQWWWSILETPELEALESETTKTGEADNISPTIKVDIVALLDYPDEDAEVTKRWLQALEDVRERRTNSGGAIKKCIISASSITKNPFVKSYLRKSLQYWQGNAAGFTKQSVMWLIGRVREARPDLWGRKIDPETLQEQKSKIAREAAVAMAQLEDAPELEAIPTDDNLQYGDSDDEDSDSDEEENNNIDEEANEIFEQNKKKSAAKAMSNGMDDKGSDDDAALVTSSVPASPPPTLVDLLLPPSKPLHNSHIISPFTWPLLAGASVCRIVHRFKRLRNEVDDSLREFREIRPLTKKERKEREENTAKRVFSDCVALMNEENKNHRSIQEVAGFLCKGGDYLDLSPLERLCVLRVLIEVAYDTVHVYQCVQDNITARKNAVTQLEKEERNAKKEAKEAAAALEQDARKRLAQQAIDDFLTKKRRELARMNKQTNEFTKDLIESLTIDEIIDMDEENKVEYESLPGPQQFSKAEIRSMVSKITEEKAFNTIALEVFTVEELEGKEDSELSSSRKDAIEVLKEAIEDGTVKALRSAIRLAKSEKLCGDDEETGGMWSLDLLRDAALELKKAEKRKKVTEAQKELIAKRNKCFVRTEELGSDRFYNKFWKCDQDLEGRIWVVGDLWILGTENSDVNSLKSRIIGASDEESDFCPGREDNFLHFSRQEYHSSGFVSHLIMRKCGCLSSSNSLRAILKYLDSRGVREGALKSSLKEIVELYGTGPSDVTNESERNNINEQEPIDNEALPQRNEVIPLEMYRNKLGRFCGRAADAPYSSSVLFLSKLLLKREQDCYASLKSRAYNENNWGGKSGSRNAWIASLKEYGNDLNAVRNGLLTLEDAFFDMCGGFHDEKEKENQSETYEDSVPTPKLSTKELLENEEARFDIELESSVQRINNGLWNSRQSRLVFREIIATINSVGFISLGLDLLCRNCMAYVESVKGKVGTTTRNQASLDPGVGASISVYSGRMTRSTRSGFNYYERELDEDIDYAVSSRPRRMNAWQQRQNVKYADDEDDEYDDEY